MFRQEDHRSDFELRVRFRDRRGDPYGWPEGDFEIELRTVGGARYAAGSRGGILYNLRRDGDCAVVVAHNHGLPPGMIKAKVTAWIPDEDFPDRTRRLVRDEETEVRLTFGPCGCGCRHYETELGIPAVRLRITDMTEEDRETLLRPALDIAGEIGERADEFMRDADSRIDELLALLGETRNRLHVDFLETVVTVHKGDVDERLTAVLTKGGEDISEREGVSYSWTRRSWTHGVERTASDRMWNAKAVTGRVLRFRDADMDWDSDGGPHRLEFTVTATVTEPGEKQTARQTIRI